MGQGDKFKEEYDDTIKLCIRFSCGSTRTVLGTRDAPNTAIGLQEEELHKHILVIF